MALEGKSYLRAFFLELKVAMFLCEAVTIDDLKVKKVPVTGRTREWLEELGLRLQ